MRVNTWLQAKISLHESEFVTPEWIRHFRNKAKKGFMIFFSIFRDFFNVFHYQGHLRLSSLCPRMKHGLKASVVSARWTAREHSHPLPQMGMQNWWGCRCARRGCRRNEGRGCYIRVRRGGETSVRWRGAYCDRRFSQIHLYTYYYRLR